MSFLPDREFFRSLFSPCGAISLSVRLRVAFGNSTCQEDITFAAFNSPTKSKPKFKILLGSIVLIRGGIVEESDSSYWQQIEQVIGFGLQRCRLG
jgi:hypothetical protein